jgi:hypothetical protein
MRRYFLLRPNTAREGDGGHRLKSKDDAEQKSTDSKPGNAVLRVIMCGKSSRRYHHFLHLLAVHHPRKAEV